MYVTHCSLFLLLRTNVKKRIKITPSISVDTQMLTGGLAKQLFFVSELILGFTQSL
jgi:hypothetical protein